MVFKAAVLWVFSTSHTCSKLEILLIRRISEVKYEKNKEDES